MEKALKKIGVDLFDEFGACRSFGSVLDDVAKCYDNSSKEVQQYIIELFSGLIKED